MNKICYVDIVKAVKTIRKQGYLPQNSNSSLNTWRCNDCKTFFKNKKDLIRHFSTFHKTSNLWYNDKRVRIAKIFNPSRRDKCDLSIKEFESPGNRLPEKVGFNYRS